MIAEFSDIPKGWETTTIRGATTLVTRGLAPAYVDDSPILAIGQSCVQDSGLDVNVARPHDPRFMRHFAVPMVGDILLNSTGTGTIGRSCVFSEPGEHFVVDSHITLLRPRKDILDSRFLVAVMQSPSVQRFLENYCYSGSTNQIELISGSLPRTPITLPPLREQKRIMEVLVSMDKQISRAEAMISKQLALEHALSSLECDGNTDWMPIGELADIESGFTLGSEPSGSSSIQLPYLRVANVQDGYIDTTQMKKVRVLRSQVVRYMVEPEDVLLTEGGDFDKLGRGAVWDGRIYPCLHQNHIFRIRCRRDLILPEYLAIYTASRIGRRYFLSVAKQTTNLASINSAQLKAMPIPLLPLSDQERILRPVRAVRTAIDREQANLMKLRMIKEGLADDLLTGRVRVDTLS